MSESTPAAPAGWHPDGSGNLRYWDGTQWTAHTATAVPPTSPTRPTRVKKVKRAKSNSPVWMVVSLVALLVGIAWVPRLVVNIINHQDFELWLIPITFEAFIVTPVAIILAHIAFYKTAKKVTRAVAATALIAGYVGWLSAAVPAILVGLFFVYALLVLVFS